MYSFELPSEGNLDQSCALTVSAIQLQLLLQGVTLQKIAYRTRLQKTR
jgi:hypothetical protein